MPVEDPALLVCPNPVDVPELLLETFLVAVLPVVVVPEAVLAALLVDAVLAPKSAPAIEAVTRVAPAKIAATARRAFDTAGVVDMLGRLLVERATDS